MFFNVKKKKFTIYKNDCWNQFSILPDQSVFFTRKRENKRKIEEGGKGENNNYENDQRTIFFWEIQSLTDKNKICSFNRIIFISIQFILFSVVFLSHGIHSHRIRPPIKEQIKSHCSIIAHSHVLQTTFNLPLREVVSHRH
jgi:hypothetical protein